MRKNSLQLGIPLKYHLWFWSIYFLFNVLRWGSFFGDYLYSFKSNLVEFSLHIVICYFNVYYLIPKFFIRKKYITYLLTFLPSLFLICTIRTALNYFLITDQIWPEADGIHKQFGFNYALEVVLGELYVVALVTVIYMLVEWRNQLNRNAKLREEKVKTELKLLKSQIQPHFFFNTLNNLYALTQEKSEKAPELVIKLSEMMQYVLYEVQDSKISLMKEINYLINYNELQNIRFGNKIETEFKLEGDLNGKMVPPLIFLPYLENSYKHGVKNNENPKIIVNFKSLEKQKLLFTIQNTFSISQDNSQFSGLGDRVTHRRLDLLYPNQFKIKTYVEKNLYNVELEIPE